MLCAPLLPNPMTVSALRRLLLAVVLLLGLSLPQPAWADGAQLFELHCAGCHLNGGNIIRRGKTLKLAALERQGCLLYTSPSPRDQRGSRMPSSA